MRLNEKLRHAEEYGAKAVHAGAEQVRNGRRGLENNLHALTTRRKAKGGMPVSAHADTAEQAAPSAKVRTGIVSIHGRDVEQMRCTGGRKS